MNIRISKSLFVFLVAIACVVISTAQTNEPKLLETKNNTKYDLSISFYEVEQATIAKLKKAEKELGVCKVSAANSFEVWSPEGEYLILGDDANIRIFKSSFLKDITERGLSADEFIPDYALDNLKRYNLF